METLMEERQRQIKEETENRINKASQILCISVDTLRLEWPSIDRDVAVMVNQEVEVGGRNE